MPANYYKKANLNIVRHDRLHSITFPDEETQKLALEYIQHSAQDTLLFTANDILYIPMPIRAQYPAYRDYLCKAKGISGTLAIIMIPRNSPEQPLGHTYPSLKLHADSRYIPLHTGGSHASQAPGYFSGKTSVPVVYETKEISTPIGAAIFIGINHRQNDVLIADHILAQHLIDVPQTLNYRALDHQGNLVRPESGIINCVTFSIDYFAKGVGIDMVFPFTNNSNTLIEVSRSYREASIETVWDMACLMQPTRPTAKIDFSKPRIILSQIAGQSSPNPMIFADANEVYHAINHLKNNVDDTTRKSLQAFSENILTAQLLELGISVEGGELRQL